MSEKAKTNDLPPFTEEELTRRPPSRINGKRNPAYLRWYNSTRRAGEVRRRHKQTKKCKRTRVLYQRRRKRAIPRDPEALPLFTEEELSQRPPRPWDQFNYEYRAWYMATERGKEVQKRRERHSLRAGRFRRTCVKCGRKWQALLSIEIEIKLTGAYHCVCPQCPT